MKNRKVLLSTLWIFLTANYIFCDLLSNMMPEVLQELVEAGKIAGISLNQGFLLGTALFMEIPFAMILLSRVLNYRANRWANMIAASLMALAQIASLFLGTATLHYLFYSVIEIAGTLFIVWYAWSWSNSKDNSDSKI